MTGPEQEKLRRGVDGASSGDLLAASDKWGTASLLLRQVADQLAVHASTPREVIGGLTGSATSEAFVRSSKAMGDKSDELNNGSNALLSAGRALSQAENEHNSLGPQPALEGRPPATPGPSTPESVREQSAYDTYAAGWHADFERREARARQANEQMEAAFRDSSAEMRKIHGQQEKPPIVEEGWPPEGTEPSGGAGGGGAVGTGGGSGHGGGHGGGHGSGSGGGGDQIEWVPGNGTTTQTTPTGGTTDPGTTTTVGTFGTLGGDTTAGSAQGGSGTLPGTLTTAGGTTSTGSAPTSSAAGTAIGAGGVAVAAGGGLMAGGATGSSVRGGLTATPTASGGSGRAFGATSARGGTPTLGRSSTTVAGTGGTQAAGSRGSGTRSGSAGRGGRSTVTNPAAAGQRRSGPAGTAGQSGSSRGTGKKRSRDQVDHLVEEWEVDDEDIASPVID